MTKRHKILLSILMTAFLGLLVFNFALAQANLGVAYGNNIGLSNRDVRDIAVSIIQVALGFLGIIAVIFVLYAGWMWMSSVGDAARIEKARKILVSAVIGIIIILAAWGITAFLIRNLGNAIGIANCTPGTSESCNGCSGSGYKTCQADGSWSRCSSACNIGENCCSGICQIGACSSGPNPDNCDANPLTLGVCELDQDKCDLLYGSGNSICDPGLGCRCRELGGVGDSCDSDIANGTCDADDTACQSWLHCDITSCTCVGGPVIESLSPVDGTGMPVGKAGNFMTIAGRYFGTASGQVLFWNGSDYTVPAAFPDTVNPNCSSNWSDTQVIVIVPAGAVDGPVKLVRADSEADATDDAHGPVINDFKNDGITRPGSCKVDPISGYFSDAFTINGINYNGTVQKIKFGNQTSSSSADNVNFTDNLTANGEVSNLKAAKTSLYAQVDGVSSNYLGFQILYDYANAPFISYIDPATGTPEQYITIYGGNFKGYLSGTSQVMFIGRASGNSYPADGLDMPAVCQDSWWKDKRIVVKVPAGTSGNFGLYDVTVTNRDGNTSQPADFEVRSGLPGPGLCKLDPTNGPVNQAITLYGDNFDSSQGAGFVRFYNNIAINSFNPGDWSNQEIQTGVPTGAETGPVRVSQYGQLSNSLPFKVGFCSTDSECDTASGEACCGSGTYWSGICRPAGDCGAAGAAGAEFAWTFTTAGAAVDCPPGQEECAGICCDSGEQCVSGTCTQPPDSCSGYNLTTCALNQFCPNSPGQCSPYGGGNPAALPSACGTPECQDRFGAGFSYNQALDRCVETGSSCALPRENDVIDVFGRQLTAYCAEESGSGRWHVNTPASCPQGPLQGGPNAHNWISVGNSQCIEENTTCGLCSDGLTCYDDSGGVCAQNQDICPGTSVCNASNQCQTNDNSACECCCEIGQDARDCCAPLTCEGTCGSDTTDDGTGFGECSGCADAADPDAACNCLGSSGKYCEIGDPAYPDGVCRDCSRIGADTTECGAHADVCCIDNVNSDSCRGGDGNSVPLFPGYCAYYSCDTVDPTVCNATAVINGDYRDESTCRDKCAASQPQPPETTCEVSPSVCDLNICGTGYECISDTPCGNCCCDLNNDQCADINPKLSCNYVGSGSCADGNKGDGNDFGLCCGCSADSDCGGTNGCGNDTCCHARPEVTAIVPENNETGVCRNPLVKAEFNQPMDIGSLAGNFILVGNYVDQACPVGTQFLVRLDPKPRGLSGIIDSVYAFFKRIGNGNAYNAQAVAGNFCAITGATSGYNGPNGVLTFSPSRVLEPNITYYAIVKGDPNPNDAKSEGVRSAFGISFTGSDSGIFNAIQYDNSRIWSFTTGSEICKLTTVKVEPESYLFSTAKNDASDDNITSAAFDTVLDRDKAFFAYAYSSNGQPVAPIPGHYDWEWNWNSDNPSVAQVAVLSSGASSTAMVTAQDKKDASTYIRATANIITDDVNNPSTLGQARSDRATVYVFMCGNPWPPRAANGNWSPWRDSSGNCTVPNSGDCDLDNNFEIYYCRDSGGAGTADDLPSIASSTVIRGKSDPANILKEFYFLRDAIPNVATSSILAYDQQTGTTVLAIWALDSRAAGYKLYWGQKSRSYGEPADIDTGGNTDYPQINCFTDTGAAPPTMNCLVGGLKTGATYYFAYTAYYPTKAESTYSREMSATPTDSTPPMVPAGLSATASDRDVRLVWIKNSDDTASYRLYYGVNQGGPYGSVEDLGNVSGVDISGLANNTTYYFTLTAIDAYNNESSTTPEVSATPGP